MNCEGVRAVLSKGLSTTTVAERNAACVHLRTCKDCQAVVTKIVEAIPPDRIIAKALAAAEGWAKDRADPEWK